MYYDIRSVGIEFLTAENFRKKGDMENAIEHYKLALAHYNNADNEYLLNPDSPYEEILYGETISYPSVNEMVRICRKEINRQDGRSNHLASNRFLSSIKEFIKKIFKFRFK